MLPTATDVRQDIYNLALQLLSEALGYAIGGTSAPKLSGSGGKKSKTWKKGAPIRLLTITCINLTDAAQGEQLSLFDASFNKQNEKLSNLNDAMDEIRDKFGSGAITYGRIVNNDIGLDTKTYAESHKKDDRTVNVTAAGCTARLPRCIIRSVPAITNGTTGT